MVVLCACRSTATALPFSPENSVHGPTFATLAAAAEAGDDALGRQILARLDALPLTAQEREWWLAYERIFDGRDLIRRLDLRLAIREEGGEYLLLLAAVNTSALDLTLRLPPVTLRRTTTSCYLTPTEEGLTASDTKRMESRASADAVEMRLRPNQVETVEVLRFGLPIGDAFAIRDHWELTLRAGELVQGDRTYPAQEPKVTGVELIRRAAYLPAARVEPAELVRHAQDEQATLPGLLERAVRVDSGRRQEALLGLREVVGGLNEEGMRRLVPALRWLSGTSRPGADPRRWRNWLRSGDAGDSDTARLDLPSEPRAASIRTNDQGGVE